MTATRTRPDADDIARAIVAAARACEEDPVEIMHGAAGKARIYAYAAIRSLFPQPQAARLSTYFGAKHPPTLVGQASSCVRAKWWSFKTLDQVKTAVAGEAEMQRREKPTRSRYDVTAALAGDPPADRSALGQGYRPGSGLVRERA